MFIANNGFALVVRIIFTGVYAKQDRNDIGEVSYVIIPTSRESWRNMANAITKFYGTARTIRSLDTPLQYSAVDCQNA